MTENLYILLFAHLLAFRKLYKMAMESSERLKLFPEGESGACAELWEMALGYSDLSGGDAVENAALTRVVLKGEPGPRRDVVLLNSAAALVAGGVAADLRHGLTLAASSIDTGAALSRLDALVAYTHNGSR